MCQLQLTVRRNQEISQTELLARVLHFKSVGTWRLAISQSGVLWSEHAEVYAAD